MKQVKKHVLACGVFDLFHVGHLRYLQYARSSGDRLTVGVSSNDIGLTIKGKCPVIPQEQRVELIGALDCVDEARVYNISLEKSEQAAQWIADWGIDHVVAGGDWQNSERWNRLIPLLAAKGISVEFAPRTEGISTSDLVRMIQTESSQKIMPGLMLHE